MTIDTKAFRSALGNFPTGVTIVTTVDGKGAPVGVTASSFNSVSLDPPLVLWSLSRSALSHDAFRSSGHFAIHVLAADQQDLSDHFARSGGDKFAGTNWRAGELGSPVIDHYAALFECRTLHQHEGGDHVIFVGEVVAFDRESRPPLVFHGGQYAETRARYELADPDHGAFSSEFVFHLLTRAYFRSTRPTRARLAELGIDQQEYLALAQMTRQSPLTAHDLTTSLEETGIAPAAGLLETLVERGFAVREGGGFALSEQGRGHVLDILATGKAFEDDVIDSLSPHELAEMKRLLRRLIDLTARDPE